MAYLPLDSVSLARASAFHLIFGRLELFEKDEGYNRKMEDEIRRRLELGKHSARLSQGFFLVDIEGEPKSKATMAKEDEQFFCTALRKEMESRKLSKYKVPIGVSIIIFSSISGPAIHAIPKNYLDLCKGIVFDDDKRVEYLFVSLSRGKKEKPRMFISFYPMAFLRQDVNLASDLALEYHIDGFWENNIDNDDNLWDWRNLQRRNPDYVQNMEPKRAEFFKKMFQSSAQEEVLRNQALSLSELQSLLVRPPKKIQKGADRLGMVRGRLREQLYRDRLSFSKLVISSKGRIQILRLPGHGYRVEQFVKDVKKAVRNSKNPDGLFAPVYHPIGLEVLFSSNPVGQDVDNVMRRVVSAFDGVFEWEKKFQSGIMMYEITRVGNDRAIGDDGQIAIGLCSANHKESLFELSQALIKKGAEEVENDYF